MQYTAGSTFCCVVVGVVGVTPLIKLASISANSDQTLSKKSRPHLDVECGWSGANEHFPQQNSNKDYIIYL
jgi:hypothetical protein